MALIRMTDFGTLLPFVEGLMNVGFQQEPALGRLFVRSLNVPSSDRQQLSYRYRKACRTVALARFGGMSSAMTASASLIA
jgi:hypothetical protein